MSEAKDEALETYTVLRERLKTGLRRVMEATKKHPHYAAALVVVVGCEAVAELLSGVDGKKRQVWEVFVQELVLPYQTLNEPMARDLFKAIRNGIAHLFETKPIVLKDERQST